MQLVHLRVAHLSKKLAPALDLSSWQHRGGFYLETCQRWVWVFHSRLLQSINQMNLPLAVDLFQGKDAYEFLIRFACGLESEIIGETDVFGQLKESWRQSHFKAEKSQEQNVLELTSWMNRVFEDTKEIRTRYIQNAGGSSYGTLVRKFIRDLSRDQQTQGEKQKVLVVGAGQIAQSIVPFLTEFDVSILNRDTVRLCVMLQDLEQKSPSLAGFITPLYQVFEQALAWEQAHHILFCVPPQSELNSEWLKCIRERRDPVISVLHLGGRKAELPEWSDLPSLFALDDLFSLQKSLGSIRSMILAQASHACEERAQLRALGQSISIPHGWEDLACFA